jgi:hypothetical protein
MHLRITSDENERSGVGEIVDEISGPTRKHFVPEDYGVGLVGVVIVLTCRDPKLNFKRRVRFAKKERKVFLDIMLDLPTMIAASPEARKREVAQRLFNEVPEVLSRYKIPDFDKDAFVADLRTWIDGLGWR